MNRIVRLLITVFVTAFLTAGATIVLLQTMRQPPAPPPLPPLAVVGALEADRADADAPPVAVPVSDVVPAPPPPPPPPLPPSAGVLAGSTIDYVGLSADMRRVSDTLERFNQKLLDVIATERSASRQRSIPTAEATGR